MGWKMSGYLSAGWDRIRHCAPFARLPTAVAHRQSSIYYAASDHELCKRSWEKIQVAQVTAIGTYGQVKMQQELAIWQRPQNELLVRLFSSCTSQGGDNETDNDEPTAPHYVTRG